MIEFHHFGNCALVSDGTLTDEQIGKIGDFILKITKEKITPPQYDEPLPDSDGYFTTITDNSINIDNVIALYVGGENFNSVFALTDPLHSYTVTTFDGDDGEKAGTYIAKLAEYADLKTITENRLYVDPDSVDFVMIDDGGNDDFEVNVIIGRNKLLAGNFDRLTDAFDHKIALEALLGL